MSSVVAWLAARSLPGARALAADDGAPVAQVRPRLPNRYEIDAINSPAAAEEIAHEAAPAATAPAPRSETPAPTPQQPEHEPERRPQRPVTVPPVPPTTPHAPERSPPRVHAAPYPEKPAAKAAPPGSQSPVEKPRSDPALPSETAPQAASPRSRPPEPAPNEATRQRPPAAPDADRTPRRVPDDKPANPVARETPRATPAPPLVTVPNQRAAAIRAAPVIAPHAELPRAPAVNVAAAAAPPRVQVTIERLEIRAATAQPPPPRRSPQRPPTMSLDAYLAARGKG